MTNIKSTLPDGIRKEIIAAPEGTNLIYYSGPVGRCSKALKLNARIAAAGGGALCQRPSGDLDSYGQRIWDYMIQKRVQKRGGAA
tara:strand:+ start:1397 stop:1651 length:255 start_codon:yes stop_codon:yes gene_type:complete